MWNETPASKLLNIAYPIVQGPFGGGASSVKLAAAVSNAGGLGSFGMQMASPEQMTQLVADLRTHTERPFALNLWMSKSDAQTEEEEAESFATASLLTKYYRELGVEIPPPPQRFIPDLDEQIATVLALAPPVFSFVFGIPSADILEACRARGILTMGTATTPKEAEALEAAGVDCIVASSFEAGGHKGSFLGAAEESLTGMFALLPQIADRVGLPIVAAGGVADARGIAAAFALGAHGVQIGSAFLACEESGAIGHHRLALRTSRQSGTVLSRAVTGRLSRNIPNRFISEMKGLDDYLFPYPAQAWFVSQLKETAIKQQRYDLVSFAAGQASPLIRHKNAHGLMQELIRETPLLLNRLRAA
ncbi:MAG TPA: nitronate monooxygenase [Herbaspirillum sp.]|jgi:nitronate monooxygenase